jgi:hypothetical protein
MSKSINYKGNEIKYVEKLANDGEVCLATKEPDKYCNGFYTFSSKDPGNGKAFVVSPQPKTKKERQWFDELNWREN